MACRLEDLMHNAKKQESIEALVNIERVRGLLWTVVQRKKFLQHLQVKRAKEKRAKTVLCKHLTWHYTINLALFDIDTIIFSACYSD
jgi:hypothetical protein